MLISPRIEPRTCSLPRRLGLKAAVITYPGITAALSPSVVRNLWYSNLRGRLQVRGSIRGEISITDEL